MKPEHPFAARADRRLSSRLAAGACAALALAAGCAVGPDYQRPAVSTPAAYKEAAAWKPAAPNDAAPRGAWWEAFQDPVLSGLELQAAASNQTLLQAAANYEAARQIARADRAQLWPSLTADGSANRSKSPGLPRSPTGYSASLEAGWQPDFWGSVRRQTESDVASAQASAAALASSRLSLQATLAEDYIELRISDENVRLLQNSIEAYQHSLLITQNKYSVGVSARSDVIEAQTQVDSTRAQLIGVGVQRAQLEHAIAVLIGKVPANFAIGPRSSLGLSQVEVPAELPSALLERRPDIAQAERQVATANAKIGVQTAAYFPTVQLSADGGYSGTPLARLFNAPEQMWSLGSQLSESLFDAGQRRDLVAAARADHVASVANYRGVVLGAFQQVEDGLVGLRILAQQTAAEAAAVAEASQAARIALNEYNAGTVDYTTVVTAQVTELNNRETALNITQSRLTTAVALMTALGGGWDAQELPGKNQILARRSAAGASLGVAAD
jgi:NodT family efflux transporter outer membrane factor (OMF) lipoprotein